MRMGGWKCFLDWISQVAIYERPRSSCLVIQKTDVCSQAGSLVSYTVKKYVWNPLSQNNNQFSVLGEQLFILKWANSFFISMLEVWHNCWDLLFPKHAKKWCLPYKYHRVKLSRPLVNANVFHIYCKWDCWLTVNVLTQVRQNPTREQKTSSALWFSFCFSVAQHFLDLFFLSV